MWGLEATKIEMITHSEEIRILYCREEIETHRSLSLTYYHHHQTIQIFLYISNTHSHISFITQLLLNLHIYQRSGLP